MGITNNQIKDITEVIKALENKGILLKITSQEGNFFNFLRSLLSAGLSIMKSVHTPLAKKVLLSFGLTAAMLATDATTQKKIHGLCTTTLVFS